jgi:hypothetical protein
MPKTKVTYKAYSVEQQVAAALGALLAAEQQHYTLTLGNPEMDGSLEERTETAAKEVKRLQALLTAAESNLPDEEA